MILRPVGQMMKNVATQLDALALDLARDFGRVMRDARALYETAEGGAHAVAYDARELYDAAEAGVRDVVDAAEQGVRGWFESAQGGATTLRRATPRMKRIAGAATAIFVRQRVLRLKQVARSGSPQLRDEDHRELAKRVAAAAAELRGGIAKLGQLASCRPDLVGPIWAGELATLQDEVPPVDAAAIRARVEAELGSIELTFSEFDDTPLAAASLAQVHAAKLLDGTDVVVKVQVPGIEDVIAADIAALRAIVAAVGEIPGIDLPTLASELARALDVELDYEAEAAALLAYRGNALVPKPIAAASSRRVLTMTRLRGERLASYLPHASDRDAILGQLVSEVAEQILVRGEIHADPHPGNFLVVDGKLALLDFGCMLHLTREERTAYARLVVAIAGGNQQAAVTELATLGFRADDPAQLAELAASIVGALRPGADAAHIDWQTAFADQVARARSLSGLVIPRSFVLLGRVLAAVAGLLATYKPKLELYPLIARYFPLTITPS